MGQRLEKFVAGSIIQNPTKVIQLEDENASLKN